MNGFSLLLALASLNVTYSWRTGVDQQQEFVLQIEPEIVQVLISGGPRGEGEEILSEIPAEAGAVQRLCIAILQKDTLPVRHSTLAEDQFRQLAISAGRYASRGTNVTGDLLPTILWPARSGGVPEQTYGITTGWQPDTAGNQQYIVQIDPSVLSTLSIGDELYVPIDPAAGRPVRFIVKTGRGQLPKIGGAGAGTLPPYSYGQNPAAGYQPGSIGNRGVTGWSGSSAPDLLRSPGRTGGYNEFTSVDGRGNQFSPLPGQNVPGQHLPGQPPPNYGGGNNYDSYGRDSYGRPLGPTAESPPGYSYNSVSSTAPQLPPQRPFNSFYPDSRLAGLPPTSLAGTTGLALDGSFLPRRGLQPEQDKPWGPLLFVTFALFFSIGGNLYLAYTALEFHSRYRGAIERLRSAARSA